VVLWVLLVLPWVFALILVLRHHHLDVAAVTVLVAVSFGLPTLWITWAAYRGPRRSGAAESSLPLAQVADRLAVAVGRQWDDEARVRRLDDPWPLPVSWTAADPSLTDAWDSLVRQAASGDRSPPPAAAWAAGPDELAGTGELAGVLARRLVVLGEPGAGKTMLMVRLVRDLLTRRDPGGPVPFLAPVASWNPSRQELRSWLASRLVIDHPALAAPPPAGVPEPTQAAALLASGLVLPVLDGLDEIPEQVRGQAISHINEALRPGQPLVVTCRTQQYRDAVRPQGGREVTLRGAAAVQVGALDAGAVREYLSDDAAGPAARARWEPVLAVLGTEAPAAQALSTPLMVGLARAIYNPRPGELAGNLRDPAELCKPVLPDRRAVESLLFDAFIPAVYQHDPGGRWKAPDAEKWLVFLARHLERKIASPDLAWWQLRRSMPRTAAGAMDVVGVAVGVAAGVTVGLGMAKFIVVAGARVPVAVAVGLMFAAGVMAGFPAGLAGRSAEAPARGVRISAVGACSRSGSESCSPSWSGACSWSGSGSCSRSGACS
jgi:NACHT domain